MALAAAICPIRSRVLSTGSAPCRVVAKAASAAHSFSSTPVPAAHSSEPEWHTSPPRDALRVQYGLRQRRQPVQATALVCHERGGECPFPCNYPLSVLLNIVGRSRMLKCFKFKAMVFIPLGGHGCGIRGLPPPQHPLRKRRPAYAIAAAGAASANLQRGGDSGTSAADCPGRR